MVCRAHMGGGPSEPGDGEEEDPGPPLRMTEGATVSLVGMRLYGPTGVAFTGMAVASEPSAR